MVNPAPGDAYAEASECSRRKLDAAMDAAAEACGDWRGMMQIRRKDVSELGGKPERLFVRCRETSEVHRCPGDSRKLERRTGQDD